MSDIIPYNNDETPEEEAARYRRIWQIIVIVVIMIAIVLTFGWFYMQEKRKEEERKQEEERKKQEEREKKIKRLAEVEKKIQQLQAIKEKLKIREKRIIIGIRIGIGALLVLINFAYKYYKIYPFDFENDIGKLLNLNASILTAYSFLAFMTFGTITNFVKRMKSILSSQLRKKHLHSLAELEALIIERNILVKELEIF